MKRLLLALALFSQTTLAAPIDDAAYILADPLVAAKVDAIGAIKSSRGVSVDVPWARRTVVEFHRGTAPAPTPTPNPTPTPTPTPAPAPTNVTTVSGQTALLNVLSGAQGGETIKLADGNYSLNIVDKSWVKEVVIEGGRGARFGAWNRPTRVKNLRVKGVTFALSASASNADLLIDPISTENLTLEDVQFLGNAGKGLGVWTKKAGNKNLRIIGGRSYRLWTAHMLQGVENALIEGHDFDSMGSDGIKIGGGRDAIIRRNRFHDTQKQDASDHPDAIQVQGAIDGITIEDNYAEGATQGFNRFMGGQDWGRVKRAVIQRNEFRIRYVNAIAWTEAEGIIRDNRLFTVDPGQIPLIRLTSSSFQVSGNTRDGKPF